MDHPMKGYRGLEAWQKAMELAELVYSTTRSWPREELYGLTSQIRRAAVSVPSNIAEGQGRMSVGDSLHHLSIARGSLLEVETQAMLDHRFGYMPKEAEDHILQVTAQTGRLINGLARYLISQRAAKP